MTPHDRDARPWGYLFLVGGALLLAANLGLMAWAGAWLWALVFLAGGAAFLLHWRATPEHWWALLPGAALSGTGIVFLAGDAGGPAFLAVLAAGFAAVFLTGRERWWAVLPAGILLTLAAVAWLDLRAPRLDTAPIFFLGLAATFATLALLPPGRGRQPWAVWPALATAALAAIVLLSQPVTGTLLPLLLVAAGAFLLVRRGRERPGRPTPPPPPATPAPPAPPAKEA